MGRVLTRLGTWAWLANPCTKETVPWRKEETQAS